MASSERINTHPAGIRVEARLRAPGVGDGLGGHDDRAPPSEVLLPPPRPSDRLAEEVHLLATGDMEERGETTRTRRPEEGRRRRRSPIGIIRENQRGAPRSRYHRNPDRRHIHRRLFEQRRASTSSSSSWKKRTALITNLVAVLAVNCRRYLKHRSLTPTN